MVGKIFHITSTVYQTFVRADGAMYKVPAQSKYTAGKFEDFVKWIRAQRMYQLDIETNVTEWWCEYKLISLQFGSCSHGKERVQWFIQWSALSDGQKAIIKEILQDKTQIKLIHNAKFEYIVLKFHGIVIDNIYDTMLAEKVLRGGLSNEDYALADISWKYLRIQMNKTEQQSFGDDAMTDSKILYGVTDVAYLDVIRRLQLEEAAQPDEHGITQMNTIGLEMEALPAFSDITYEGMILDLKKWRENLALAEPIVQNSYDKLIAHLNKEPLRSFAIKNKFLIEHDTVVANYNSPQQKQALLSKIFPDIKGSSKAIIQKYLRDNAHKLDDESMNILLDAMERKYDHLQTKMVNEHKNWLIENGFLLPAGHCAINWNSDQQVLKLFQVVAPKIKGTGEEARNKFPHIAVIRDYGEYVQKIKLLESFGEAFIQQYVDPQGRVRCNFNQVISTGRVSTSNPNMQNIVVGDKIANANDPTGTRYRNAFVAPPHFKFVDSDYTSQELCVIAFMSGDPVFLDCLSNGYDLHSVCAEMIFGSQWKQGTDINCAYYNMVVGPDGRMRAAKQKCKCLKHKALRDKVKPINFGLAYGMTEYKLSGALEISLNEARGLIDAYFDKFPRIGAMLNTLANFALDYGYVMTLAPFCRKRWFPYWHENRRYVEPHKLGVQFNPTLGSVEREGKNMPIQGASADMVKLAMVLIRNYIYEHDMQDYIKIVAQVHDQVTTICHEDHAEWWAEKMDELMKEAAKLVIPTGILKAETNITEVWTK